MSRRVLITGGAGFVGSHLSDRLMSDGWSVICADNFITGSASNVSHLMGRAAFRVEEVDVAASLEVDESLDAVLHFCLAGLAGRLPQAAHRDNESGRALLHWLFGWHG